MVKRITRGFFLLLVFFLGVILFIRSPWGQDVIINKVIDYVFHKTGTDIAIERIFVTFSGDIQLEGLYLGDQKGDTLLYSKSLEADIAFSPLLFENTLELDNLEWEGVTARIIRKEDTKKFNFTFLQEALIPQDSAAKPEKAEPFQLAIGSIALKDFDVDYTDAFLGIDSKIICGNLLLEVDEVDLKAMYFAVDNLEIQNSQLAYEQTKAIPTTDGIATPVLPHILIDNLSLENVQANYGSKPNDLEIQTDLSEFSVHSFAADIAKTTYEVEDFTLNNSKISVKIEKIKRAAQASNTNQNFSDFQWPAFIITALEIDMENNTLFYGRGNIESSKGVFNPNAISLQNFSFNANNLTYEPKLANLNVEALSFLENSGFLLQSMTFESRLGDTASKLNNFSFVTGNSAIMGEIALKYASINQLFNNPKRVQVEVKVPMLRFGLEDAFFFQPALAANTYVDNAKQHGFRGKLFAKGTLEKITLDKTRLQWGNRTSVALTGTISNPTNVKSLSFDLGNLDGLTSRSDVLLFVSEEALGIAIPEEVNLNVTAQGSFQNFIANATVKIPEGNARLVGNLNFRNNFNFNGRLDIDSLRLNKLLKNEEFGAVSLTTYGSISGTSLTSLKADFTANISRFQYNGYDYKNIAADGKINNGTGDVALSYKDENLDFSTAVDIQLDTTAYAIQMDLELKGADLQALKLATNDIKVRTGVKVLFTGTSEDFDLNASLSGSVAVMDKIPYKTKAIDLIAHIDSTVTQLEVSSGFLNGNLDANSSPEKITNALERQLRSYFSDAQETNAETDSVRVQLNAILTPEPILTEVFFKGLEKLDTVTLHANFDAVSKKLYAALEVPAAAYESSILDSLKISLNGDAENLDFSTSIGGLAYKPINIKKTLLTGNLKNKELLLEFVSFDEDEALVQLAAEMSLRKDTLQLHINPKELTFNKKNWSIPSENRMVFSKDYLFFEHMILSSDNQKMELSGAVPEIQEDHIGLLFENFQLQALLSFFNPDKELASGILQGRLILENPFGARGVIANLTIDELALLTNPVGKFSIDATSNTSSNYTLNMALKDGGIDVDLSGKYTASAQGANLDMNLDLQKLETQFIQDFFLEEIAEAKGYLSGQLKFDGTLKDPVYQGQISFHETALKVVPLNVTFKIGAETIVFDDTKISLDQFAIQDTNGNSLTLNGNVGTKTWYNPSFDLSFKTENFSLLNATLEDNELYYGIVSADTDVQISGDLSLPRVRGKIGIRKGTELTYVVPEEQLDIQERDGVVIFVNRENPDDILTGNEQEETSNRIKGFDIDLGLKIAKDVVFNIVLDQRTDDRLQVQGDANFKLNIDPNGTIGLNGRYELNNGFYQTNLYNLVSRKFNIRPGSSITWLGDPFDAKLDLTAIYKIETSPAPLMAQMTSGVDTGLASAYQDKVPFLVYLNVKGKITEPNLSFELDIPKDAQSDAGGVVYGRVQQLNDQESELNKQVFSLLAFSSFFPTTGSDGSSGGASTVARNNVNQVLSGGLNAFSEKVFGNSGFELDFELDSFTDYRGTASQDRTKLNINAKDQFFDDRLIVSVGSSVDVNGSNQPGQKDTPIIGNVSLEYLLTKNGRYRLKGYQKNEYTNIIDGQLIVSGLAFIFDREFNKFSELFRPMKDIEENDRKNDLKKKKEKTTIE